MFDSQQHITHVSSGPKAAIFIMFLYLTYVIMIKK